VLLGHPKTRPECRGCLENYRFHVVWKPCLPCNYLKQNVQARIHHRRNFSLDCPAIVARNEVDLPNLVLKYIKDNGLLILANPFLREKRMPKQRLFWGVMFEWIHPENLAQNGETVASWGSRETAAESLLSIVVTFSTHLLRPISSECCFNTLINLWVSCLRASSMGIPIGPSFS